VALKGPSEIERAKLSELSAEPPRLMAEPKPVTRKQPGVSTTWTGELKVASAEAPDAKAMQKLMDSVALTPGTQFVPAPAFDEEHPEELSYRPFPIAPLLTLTASADDPALAKLEHPNLAKTLEYIDQGIVNVPMKLRPGPQSAQVLWAQQFKGDAANFWTLSDPDATPEMRLKKRKVVTSAQ
jgi:hypothetical protein